MLTIEEIKVGDSHTEEIELTALRVYRFIDLTQATRYVEEKTSCVFET